MPGAVMDPAHKVPASIRKSAGESRRPVRDHRGFIASWQRIEGDGVEIKGGNGGEGGVSAAYYNTYLVTGFYGSVRAGLVQNPTDDRSCGYPAALVGASAMRGKLMSFRSPGSGPLRQQPSIAGCCLRPAA